jgi:GDP-D-mannose dehydratase
MSYLTRSRHIRWRNSGVQEEGYDAQSGRVVVKVDPQYFRPAEVEYVYFVSSRFLSANAYT